MSHPVINEDSVIFDDDVVEINTIGDEDPSVHTNPMTNKRVQKKRKKTSLVWTHFDEIRSKDPNDSRIWAKCKFCDHKYIANSSHGTGNLQKHMKVCGGKNDHDIQQLLLSRDQGTGTLSEFLAFDGVDSDANKTQLELYLDEPKYVEKNATFDILSFWKGNEFRYSEVAAMARDILSIPISTVASESTFSVGGRVIDQYRSSLKPDIVEAIICTRDWLYGEQEQALMTVDNEEEDVLTFDSISSCEIPSSSGAC